MGGQEAPIGGDQLGGYWSRVQRRYWRAWTGVVAVETKEVGKSENYAGSKIENTFWV